MPPKFLAFIIVTLTDISSDFNLYFFLLVKNSLKKFLEIADK
jgi:hypothetical protein